MRNKDNLSSSLLPRTLVVLDERGAAARVPGQILSLAQGRPIVSLSDTRHAPYRTMSRASVTRIVLLCLDLLRGYRFSAAVIASAAACRAALPAARLGCARFGAVVYEGAALAAKEVSRRHHFGGVALLGAELVDKEALEAELSRAGLGADVRAIPLGFAPPGGPGEDALRRLIEAQRKEIGTYVLGSAEAAAYGDLVRGADPDAVIVEADAAIAMEVAAALDEDATARAAPANPSFCITELSQYWQEHIASLAGVARDDVAGRWVMPAGPNEGPFAIPIDEDGDPLG